ncbi:unnamed protein product [Closterium sp. NIES-64]|nr:unnamed protein product [Closterium sp. NIES-64]CAI5993311.1 unnamed protein product [Closterium sp. NIES-65]
MNRSSALSSYGQNLLSTFGIGQWAPSEVVNVWLDEKKFYTYSPLPVAQSDLLLPEFFLEGFVANIRESESQAASMGPQGPESTDSVLPPTTELSAPPPDISPGATNKKKRRLKVKLPAIKDVPWKGMFLYAMEWMSNPINAASFFWCVLATFAFVIVVMCELGLMKNYIHDHETLEEVKEVSTQILNALFVLMCLIWHPVFMRDVLLLIRWKPKDKWEIRAEYCKDGKRKPNDRTHMAFVVFWLQLTCWATYAFAAVFLVYPMGERPMSLIIVTTVVSFAAPAFAFLHLLLSPLSKDYDIVRVGEGDGAKVQMFQRSATFMVSHTKVEDAQWAGSVVPGCCSEPRVACLSCFFPCCMFGYNMERLGFGHRIVHAMMFVIMLIGPVLIFELCADAVHADLSKNVLFYLGVAIAITGLAYGGAWRVKIRETYKLPGSRWWCGSRRLTDICIWVWCCWCALCQEVRTTDQYQVVENSFYRRAGDIESGSGAPAPAGALDTVPDAEEEVEEDEEDDELDAPAHQTMQK